MLNDPPPPAYNPADTEMLNLAPPPYNPEGESNFSDPKVAEFFSKHDYPENIKQEFHLYDIFEFQNLEKNALTEMVGIGAGTKLYNEISQSKQTRMPNKTLGNPPDYANSRYSSTTDAPPLTSEIYAPPPAFNPSVEKKKSFSRKSLSLLNPNRRYSLEKKVPPHETKQKKITPLVCENSHCSRVAKSGSSYCQRHHVKIVLKPDPKRDWRQIPNVVGIKICECLPIIVIAGISGVCKSWDNITCEPILWDNFVSTMEKQKNEHISMVASKYKNCPQSKLTTTFNSELTTLKTKKIGKKMSKRMLLGKSRGANLSANPKKQYSRAMAKVLTRAEEHQKAEQKAKEDRVRYEKLNRRRERTSACINSSENVFPFICGIITLCIIIFLILCPLSMDKPWQVSWGASLTPLLIAFGCPLLWGLLCVPFACSGVLDEKQEFGVGITLLLGKSWFLFTLLLYLKLELGWHIPNLLVLGMPIGVIIAFWIMSVSGLVVNEKSGEIVPFCVLTPLMCLIPMAFTFAALEADYGSIDSPISRGNAFIPLWIFLGLMACGMQSAILGIIAPLVFIFMAHSKYMHPLSDESWTTVFIPLWVSMGCIVCGIIGLAMSG